MRLLPILLVWPLLALQVPAQAATTAPAPSPAPAAAGTAPAVAPAAATHPAVAQAKPKPRRMTWQQRFAQANTTRDGHLTLGQAEAGYRTIARHFTEIDTGKKGYVTVEDVNNWHKQQRAARKIHQSRALKHRPAMHRDASQQHRTNTPAASTIAQTR